MCFSVLSSANVQVAPEYEARLAEIRAVEDEDIMCLGDGMQKTLAAASSAGGSGTLGFDDSTKKHHDAIFAPAGSVLSQPVASTAAAPTSVVAATGRVGSAGVMGAAARARLVLTGKVGEEASTTPKLTRASTTRKTTNGSDERSRARDDDADKPLYKNIRVCTRCG